MDSSQIETGLADVRQRITDAAARSGRSSEEITLVAVTKTWPPDVVIAAYEVGLRQFGENRAEELASKRAAVLDVLGPDCPIIWHQIGTLQSRKTNLVAANADVFHALDRSRIARRLSSQLHSAGKLLPTFVEVNVSGEASKSGFDASNWEHDATQREALRKEIETIAAMPGLQLQGLMTMAPWDVDEDTIRLVFRRTRQLADWLQTAVPQATLSLLSMGMTDDFEIAIEEGATHVRIGRAIFGSRA